MKITVLEKDGVAAGDNALIIDLKHNLPSRRRMVLDGIKFELTLANIRYINTMYPAAVWDNPGPVQRLLENEYAKEKGAALALENIPPEAFAFPFKLPPFIHQGEAWYLCKDAEYFALLMEMGTGKTKVGIDKTAYNFKAGRIDTLLITAPNGVHNQWITEQIPEHMPDFVTYKAIAYTSNHTKKFLAQLEDVLAQPGDVLKIISMHIESFSTKKGVDIARRILDNNKVLWILDESDGIKNPSTSRTKSILKMRHLAVQRVIMSGAPITEGTENLFTQLKFLHEDILGFTSYSSFLDYFCIQKPIPGAHYAAKKIVGYRNVDQIQKALASYSYRKLADDCLDLPKQHYTTRDVPLTPEQTKIYNELKYKLITQLESGEIVTATMALTRLMKLQQVVCGFLIPEVGAAPIPIKSNRVQVALDVMNQIDGKAIIWARFKQDIINLRIALKKAGYNFVEYHGGVDMCERDAIRQAFNEDDSIDGLLGNATSGGTGLNLQRANTMMYYSNGFSARDRWQSEKRIHRIGQDKRCLYIDLVAQGTVDNIILNAHQRKKDVADAVLDIKNLISQL